jgi:uncharacterized protein YceK
MALIDFPFSVIGDTLTLPFVWLNQPEGPSAVNR